MARITSGDLGAGGSTGTEKTQAIAASPGETVTVPSLDFITHSEILRDGQDLILQAPDGSQLVITDYFAMEPAPLLAAPNGATLTPELVQSFVHSAQAQYAAIDQATDESPVGAVQEVSGTATVTRADGTVETLAVGMPIFQGDVIETDAEGAVNIVFIDETSFAVSEDAKLAIDEYVFDPASSSGTTNFSVLRGMFVFSSGLIGREDPDDVKIETPVGSIGIRGTTIAGNVTTGEIVVVEGAIVLRSISGQEVTLATQFEAARFSAQGVTVTGTVEPSQLAQNFSRMGSVTPAFFSAIGAEAPANDNPGNTGNAPSQNNGADGAAQGTDGGANRAAPDGAPAPAGTNAAPGTTGQAAEPPPPPGADLSMDMAGGNSFSSTNSFGSGSSFDNAASATGSATAGGASAVPASAASVSPPAAASAPAAVAVSPVADVLPPPPNTSPNATTTVTPPAANMFAPVFANGSSFTIAENSALTTPVSGIMATDADGNALTYSIVGGTGAALFAIDSAGRIAVNGALDYETANSYTLELRVTDGVHTVNSVVYTINVSNINESAVFTSGTTATVAENAAAATLVYTAVAIDPESAVSYSIVSGDAGRFQINASTGQLMLIAGGTLDYETTQSYTIVLRAFDGTHAVNHTVNVMVTDVDDTPVTLANNTGADVDNGESVVITSAMLSVTDPDTLASGLTYTLVTFAGGQLERLEAPGTPISTFTQAQVDAGQIVFVHDGVTTGAVSFEFTATDGTNTPLVNQTFMLNVIDSGMIAGDAGNNTLTGDAANNTIYGYDGNDTLIGGGGNNTLDGGAGFDTADYSTAAAAIVVDLAAGTVSANGYGGVDTLVSIEGIIGTAYADTIKGSVSITESLSGGAGNDVIYGFTNDTVSGGSGDDTIVLAGGFSGMTINGGAGVDTLKILNGGNVDLSTLTMGGIEVIDALNAGAAVNLSMKTISSIFSGLENGKIQINLDGNDSLNLDMGASAGTDAFRIVSGNMVTGNSVILHSAGLNVSIEVNFMAGTVINLQGVSLPGADLYLNGMNQNQGYWVHDNIGEGFGFALASLGDVDGDGYDDVGILKEMNAGGSRLFTLSGDSIRAGSAILPAVAGTPTNIPFSNGGSGNEMSLAYIGDFDGDGYNDYVIGAPYANDQNTALAGSGAVQIVSGLTGFTILDIGNSASNANMGAAVAGVGDVNGDGYADVLIGAPNGATGSGYAYLLFGGNTDPINVGLTFLPDDGTKITGTGGSRLGTNMTGIGDFNGDGFDDFMLSAPNGAGTGVAHIVFGAENMPVINLTNGTMKIDNINVGTERDIPMAALGDINGDGMSDIAVASTNGAGELHIFLGGNARTASATAVNAETADYRVTVGGAHTIIGGGGAGDFNGDGNDDFAVAVLQNGTQNVDIYVVFGGAGLAATMDMNYLNSSGNTYHMVYTIPNGTNATDLSIQIAAAGDVDGDGYGDLALGFSGLDNNSAINPNASDGSVAVVYGRTWGPGGTVQSSVSAAAGDRLIGTNGNDVLTQGSPGHSNLVMRGGSGDDTFEISNNMFADIDGGNGIDLIDFMSGSVLDLSAFTAEDIKGIEGIVMTGTGQTLQLSLQNVFMLMKQSDNGAFVIEGDSTAALTINRDGTDISNMTAAMLSTELGADSFSNVDADYYDFFFGGHTLSIAVDLINSGNVTVT